MVRASTIFVAALAVAPVLAVPMTEGTEAPLAARSVDDAVDLDARKFKIGKAFKKLKSVAKVATKLAAPGAGLLMRDIEDGTYLDVREPTIHIAPQHPHHPSEGADHSHQVHHANSETRHRPRQLDLEISDFEARSPTVHSGHHSASSHAHHSVTHQPRDLEEEFDLDARTPLKSSTRSKPPAKSKKALKRGKGRKGKGPSKRKASKGRKGGRTGANRKGKGKSGARRPNTRRLTTRPRSFDNFEEEVYTRDLDPVTALDELLERGFLEVDLDLVTREPKFRLGNFLKKAVGVAGKVAKVGAGLALREEEDVTELDARSDGFESLDELD